MKKACKLKIRSTRVFSLGDALPSLFPEEGADWDEYPEEDALWEDFAREAAPEEAGEALPEELRGDLPTDRRGAAPYQRPETPPPTSTLISYGVYSHEKDGSYRASYEDSEITGLEGCLTTFCLSPSGMLILLRRGEVRTCLVFEEGKRHLCDYGLENGAPSVTLHTHRMQAHLGDRGGSLFVDYSVEMCGILTERNKISIRIDAR